MARSPFVAMVTILVGTGQALVPERTRRPWVARAHVTRSNGGCWRAPSFQVQFLLPWRWMMDSMSSRVLLIVIAFAIRAFASPDITKDEVDRQQQQLNKDRWQYIRDSLDLQQRADQEIQREKGALIDHIKGALEQAVTETSGFQIGRAH